MKARRCSDGPRYRPRMTGAIIFVVVMVLVVPIGVMVGGAAWSAVFGFFAVSDANRRAEGSPYALDEPGD
jgi:hypothetical protein